MTQCNPKTNEMEDIPVYTNKDTIQGEVRVIPLDPSRKAEHLGIRVQLVGTVQLNNERQQTHDFVSLVRELAPPGDIPRRQQYQFEFNNVEMQYESYNGISAQCRYMLRVTVQQRYGAISKDFPIWVKNFYTLPQSDNEIKMEVGIEECLHIEFRYNKAHFSLKDCVSGRIHFLLVKIKLKNMEIEIRRRETIGTGAQQKHVADTLAKYEIMDGAPVKGESVPIRLYLQPYDLSPTYENIHNKFSVKYFLNLVLVDEEDRRYFKQQEIVLCRTKGAGVEGS